jgi:hypothetical protein
VNLGDHDGTRNSSEIAEHSRVNTPPFGPKLDNSQEIPVNTEIGDVFLNVGVAQVAIEGPLGELGKPVKRLFVKYQFFDIILRINMLNVHCCVQ